MVGDSRKMRFRVASEALFEFFCTGKPNKFDLRCDSILTPGLHLAGKLAIAYHNTDTRIAVFCAHSIPIPIIIASHLITFCQRNSSQSLLISQCKVSA